MLLTPEEGLPKVQEKRSQKKRRQRYHEKIHARLLG